MTRKGISKKFLLSIELLSVAYPKVAPDPSMNLPRVRMTPLGPAPYWKIVTVPSI